MCTSPAGEKAQNDANGPLSDDQNGLVRLKIERLDAFHTGIYGLYEGRLLPRDVIGYSHYPAQTDNPLHDTNVLGETAPAG
jgi:hypothetical protein